MCCVCTCAYMSTFFISSSSFFDGIQLFNQTVIKRLGRAFNVPERSFGFGKTLNQNYKLINMIPALKQFKYPILVGVSRKSMISKGLKWMLNSSSPFYVKPRIERDFLKWSWRFYKSSTLQKVTAAIPVIKEINLLSEQCFKEIKSSYQMEIPKFHETFSPNT